MPSSSDSPWSLVQFSSSLPAALSDESWLELTRRLPAYELMVTRWLNDRSAAGRPKRLPDTCVS